jgi:geranylgeranyl diphosphate synthase, type I
MESVEGILERVNRPVKKRLSRVFLRRSPKEVYGLLSEFMSVEGKLLRPALCLLSCEAAGGRAASAVHAAAAIEMFHNFTLIHDDIEDDSEMRRGGPCLHVKYGLPLALNAGDGLFMTVWRESLRITGARRAAARSLLLSAFTQVLEGQAIELGWYRNNTWTVGEREYRKVVEGKTGALIAASCEVGALLGGADRKTCAAMRRFGMGIGVGFQIVDDLLNIVGDEKTYGKEIGGDVREGKRTLLTIYALQNLQASENTRLQAILRNPSRRQGEVFEAVALLKKSGAPEAALAVAEKEVATALSSLHMVEESRARAELEVLADYITRRTR